MSKPMGIDDILKRYRRIVVVGISANSDRPSHWIAVFMKKQGFDVIGVNPGKPKVTGIEVVGSLSEVKGPLEIVDVFRSPESIPPLIEELKSLKPPVVWLQPGAQNPEAEATARSYGMTVVSGPCLYAEYRRLHKI